MITKSNLTVSIDTEILRQFQLKQKNKISQLFEFWITQFLDNKKGFGP